ncbi:MAG: efflux RND transporter periplasmic adaptor subunit [Wenzhouxiangellaceae bacterium]
MTAKPIADNKLTPAVTVTRERSLLSRLLPIWIIIGAIVGAVAMTSLLREPPVSQPKPDVARLVDTVELQPRNIQYEVETFGTVMPRTETTLMAEVAGKVVEVAEAFAAGGFLRQGDLLMQIDPSDYETALLSAEANLASSKARLSQEQAQSDQARKDWQQLNPGREPNILVLRLPQLDEAKASVRAAEADLIKAKRDLQRTEIRMPYDGLVRSRAIDLGQYLTPGSTLGEVFAVDVAEVRLSLSDEELRYVRLPAIGESDPEQMPPVTLKATVNGSPVSWQGRIVRSEGVVDTESRVVYAVAQVNDPYGLLGAERQEPLKVGTFVNAIIQGRSGEDIVIIPRTNLQPDNTVFIANSENKLEVRPVEVSRTTPELAYISAGLNAGDRLITTSIAAPIPGMVVRTEIPEVETDTGASMAEQSLATASNSSGVAQ